MIVNKMLDKILFGRKVRLKYRYFSSSKSTADNIRNIAILAHIDAGNLVCFYVLFSHQKLN